jgi:predicted RNA-binding protein with RPS1 domain
LSADTVPTPPARQTLAGPHPTPADEGSFGFEEFLSLFDELMEWQLRNLQAHLSAYSGDFLRHEITTWTDSRMKTINQWACAHASVTAILREAPSGSIPDPASAASGLLNAASPHDFEERHLRNLLQHLSAYSGDFLRREIEAWLTNRIERATTGARELVRVLNEQALRAPVTQPAALPASPSRLESRTTQPRVQGARPKARRKRTPPAGKGRTYTGAVVSINAHGAVVSLDNGDQGWLHISRLRQLNEGAWVESVSNVLTIGQELRVRVTGTTERGQVELALVEVRAITRAERVSPAAAPEPSDDETPPVAESRRGGRKWFGFGRNEKDRT